MNDGELEKLLERIEVSIAMQQRVLLPDAERCDQTIDRLPHGVATSAERSVVPRRLTSQVDAAHVEHLELEQLTLDLFRCDVITNTLEHFAENHISEPEALTLQFSVNPIGLGIRDAAEVIDPNGGLDDHHVATLLSVPRAKSRDRPARPRSLAADECSSDCESESTDATPPRQPRAWCALHCSASP